MTVPGPPPSVYDEVVARLLFDPLQPGRHRWRDDPPTEEFPAVTAQPAHVQTSHPARKLGRLPAHPEDTHPRLKLKAFLRSGYKGQVPDVVDYSTHVETWPMYLNDQLGCCTAADYAHGIQLWTAYGQGSPVTVTDQDVLTFYEQSCGYNPDDPSTDQGGNMQEVCDFARKTGMAGRRIEAFFQVDPDDADEVRAALYLFGAVSVGMAFPASAMDQFDAGQPWDRVRRDGGIEGGHDVLLVGATKGGNYKVVTWGRVQEVTPAFWDRYMGSRAGGEAWVRVEQDWASKAGVAPGNALNIAQLNDAFQQLTGQPGPFIGEAPSPEPNPEPAPSDDATFCTYLREVVARVDAWLRSKGF